MASRPGAASRQRKPGFVVRGLFGLGAPELVVIAGVAALLFGPKQLPQLGKKLGQSVKSFQQVGRRPSLRVTSWHLHLAKLFVSLGILIEFICLLSVCSCGGCSGYKGI